jgi:cytochrome c553
VGTAHGGCTLFRNSLMLLLFVPLLTACRDDMQNQPRLKPYGPSDFFPNDQASRSPPDGTVPRGTLETDDFMYRGVINGKFANSLPMPLTHERLARGQLQYNIYCAVCHDPLGTGDGIVVLRGFKRPDSIHIDRLRDAPDGYLFDVITRGYGVMYDFAGRLSAQDRWDVVAYMRALQLSQRVNATELNSEERKRLDVEGSS